MSSMTKLHTTVAPYSDAAHGLCIIDGQPMLFHSNHYNRSLQQIIENCRHVDSQRILMHSAAELTFLCLQYHYVRYPEMKLKERLDYAERFYSFCGFGLLPLCNALKQTGGQESFSITTDSSHYGKALALNFEKRRSAGEYFDLGFIIGALSAVFEQSFSGELTTESIAKRDKQTTFNIRLGGDTFDYLFQLESGTLAFLEAPGMTSPIPARTLTGNINELAIMAAVNQAELIGNGRGLIPAFNVELTRNFADYYNLIVYRFEQQLMQTLYKKPMLNKLLIYDYPILVRSKQFRHLEGIELIRALLIEAGYTTGFYTISGIMRSSLWEKVVIPMLQTQEDSLLAMIAVINALGWGIWRVIELIPNEKLVIRVWRPYESLGYLRWFGYAEQGIDYLVIGLSTALMNVIYQSELNAINQYPPLTADYHQAITHATPVFTSVQTQCVAMGHNYSEVITTRRNNT